MAQSLKVVRSVCPHDCPDACGMVVTVDETGRAVELRGDREHPFTRGFLCQKVANYLDRVYHPERVLYPMKRVGPKGAGQFERISWDEAVSTIATRFRDIANSSDGPQSILPYSYAGTMGVLSYASLDRRFFHRLGASKLDRTICATAGAVGCEMTLGTRAVVDPELVRHSRVIINWGSNTAVTNSHLWAIMHQARKAGAKIITIDPYRSSTAAKSDWWLPIRPGTDAALALAIMHIIFRERWEDDDYLDRHCLGTRELVQRVAEYTPKHVASITGLAVADIEKLASDYALSHTEHGGPSFIRLNYGLQRHGGGAMAVRTIVCLPALIGSWKYPGGGALLSTSKMFPFNNGYLEKPNLIPSGTRTINMVQLAEALHGELPGPPVRGLYVYNSNPAMVAPDQSRVRRGLEREDLFTVVHEQFQTDTADYADILLPATTQLEQFDIHNSYGHLYVQVNEPAIAPIGESKPNTDVFRLLAKAMGFESSLFEISDRELAEQAMRKPDGTTPPEFEGITLERLAAEGPIRLNVAEEFLPFAQGEFPTRSGKCEFFSERMAELGFDPLPMYIPPHEDPQTKPELAAKYPLQMLSPPAAPFMNSTFVNMDFQRKQAGEPTLEIHPSDAAKRGILHGETVRIFNDRGAFTAKAVVGETVPIGTVVTLGLWWKRYTGSDANCNATTSTALTDMGGGATFFDNLVEVARI